MRSFFETTFGKWFMGIALPIFFGALGWVATMERRVSAIEIHQQNMAVSLNQISSDIHEIRSLIVDEIRKK